MFTEDKNHKDRKKVQEKTQTLWISGLDYGKYQNIYI